MIHLSNAKEPAATMAPGIKQEHRLRFSNLGDVVVVWLPEDLFELLSIVQTGEELLRYVENSKPRKLVVSFDHVRSCGSQAVGDLIKLAKKVRSYGGELKLCSMSSRIREVFDLCRLIGPIFELHQSTSEAVDSFKGSAR